MEINETTSRPTSGELRKIQAAENREENRAEKKAERERIAEERRGESIDTEA